jgi:tight adherence protein C
MFCISQNIYAKCAKEFNFIDRTCIKSVNPQNFKEIKFKVKNPDADTGKNDLIGKIYFYRTSSGNIGKFKIQNAGIRKGVCSIYLEATTYIGNEIYSPTASFSVQKIFGTWQKESLTFDHKPTEDFSLYVKNGACIFSAKSAVFFKNDIEDTRFEGSQILYYASFFLIGLAVFLIAITIFKEEDQFKAQATLEDVDEEANQPASNDFVLKYSKPFFRRYFSPIVKGMKNKKKFREKYKRSLASAGLTKVIEPEDFFAFKLFLILGFPIVFLFVRWFIEEDWPLSLVPIVSIVGFYYPNIWINGRMERRKKEIMEKMPFIVDMLALSVEAGLDFVAAMQKVIEKAPKSALVEEFEIMIKETKIGASRADGLRQLAWRVDLLPVSSFCATLIAADSVGASIGPILKTLAGELREKKSAEVEKLGATAATKILFPTMFFIIPAVFLMIAAPLVVDFVTGK